MDMNRVLLDFEQRTMTEMRNMEQKLERAILGRMELLHTQLNSKLYFIESKLDALTDSIQQQQQLQPRVFKRDPMHHRRGNGNGNGNIGNGNGNMMTDNNSIRQAGRRVYSNSYGGYREHPPSFHYYDENEDSDNVKNGARTPSDDSVQQQQENNGMQGGYSPSNFMPPMSRYNNGTNGNHYNGSNGNGNANPQIIPRTGRASFYAPAPPQRMIVSPSNQGSVSSLNFGGSGMPSPAPILSPSPRNVYRCKQRKQQMMNTYFDGIGSALNKMATANKWITNLTTGGARLCPDPPQHAQSVLTENDILNNGNINIGHSEPLRQTRGTASMPKKQWTARSEMGVYTDEEDEVDEDDDEDAENDGASIRTTSDDYKDAGAEVHQAPPPQDHAQSENEAASKSNHFMPPAEPKPADPAPAPAPALVGGFAQALSRMAAANKWSICGTSHKDAKEQNVSPCNVPASDQHEKAVVTSENATMELKKSANNEGETPKIGRRKSF